MADSDLIPNLDVEIDEKDLETGIKQVAKFLRPEWNVENLTIKPMSLGYINKNYAVQCFPPDSRGLFVRLVNTMVPGMLQTAIKGMRYLKRRGIGAQILLTYKNGLVMELLEGETISWETFYKVKEPETWLRVAREVALYHGTTEWKDIKELGIQSGEDMFVLMRITLEGSIKAKGINMKKLGLPSVDELFDLMGKVRASLIEDGAEYGFCHMDPNPTNVLLTPKGPVYVDYDFCVKDLCCAQIANFFGSITNILKPNFDDYPTEEQKEAFIREYLNERAKINPKFGPVTEKLVGYWKFLVKKAGLVTCLAATGTVVMTQQLSEKGDDIDTSIANKFWKAFKDNEKILYMKYLKN